MPSYVSGIGEVIVSDASSKFKQAVDLISIETPELRPSLLFYADMISLLNELSDEVVSELEDRRELIEELAKRVSEEGSPLLNLLGTIPVSAGIWQRILESVVSIVRDHREELTEDLNKLLEASGGGSFSIRDLATYSLKGDPNYARGVAAGLDVDLDLVNAIALWTIQPLLIALRRITERKIDANNWLRGYCPVCGSYTRTGFMEGEGRKLHLKCEICGMEWPFLRLKCPFCDNEDEKKLGFYSLNDNKFRLYVCESCGEYWKVVDEELAGKNVPRELYPVWTFELDELASKLSKERSSEDEEGDIKS
ncbi:MAG: formate dehydrogenase accessory protein FdhE [Candidatus Korarchaeota archaeon]|nr:formate dehydrogenase accessory protein FdhE [Candidatus Korarchaeota archaeon]